MPERKAAEFCRIVEMNSQLKELGLNHFWNHLMIMPDIEWDAIMSKILTNRTRDLNVDAFSLPELTRKDMLNIWELIIDNDSCGIHNSYWSRITWMVKGGPLVKAFPVNSIMEKFEKGERRGS